MSGPAAKTGGKMRQCTNCARVADANTKFCMGCGDEILGRYLPKWLLMFASIAFLAFAVTLVLKPGFKDHPRRIALAQLGLGPSEDAIAEAEIQAATHKGIVERQRDLVAFDVDEQAWTQMSVSDRIRLQDAFVQRVYARKLRDGEAVKVYDGSSHRIVSVIRNNPLNASTS